MMPSRSASERAGDRPEPGQILIVIHDFHSRSSDELSLIKGDRVELIERDDEFGDGWYLGRHLGNGSNGLFPEVYTKPAPQPAPPLFPVTPRPPPIPLDGESLANSIESRLSAPSPEANSMQPQTRHASASEVMDTPSKSSQLPVMPLQESTNTNGRPLTSTGSSFSKSVPSITSADHQQSPIMTETLTVIQEHISDMNLPRVNNHLNDSGSDYSSHIDHRMSYIPGEETDEEEENFHDREEVASWTPDQVANYLGSVGVETKHCNVFREQEISGEVLLGMEQTSVFLKEFDLGSVGRRLKTWQKIKSLQNEVQLSSMSQGRRNTQTTFGSEYDDLSDKGKQRSASNGSVVPSITGVMEGNGLRQNGRSSRQSSVRNNSTSMAPSSYPQPLVAGDGSPRIGSEHRPSAASIRDLHHSRRHSSIDNGTPSLGSTLVNTTTPDSSTLDVSHKKQPSFDKSWTLSSAAATSPRPLSSAGLKSPFDQLDGPSNTPLVTQLDVDRGYFSGGEMDDRKRNVLKKRDTVSHSRGPSYTDEQRLRAAAHGRHSRYSSFDSIRDPNVSPATQKYYGLTVRRERRTPSTSSLEPPHPRPPPKDSDSPMVTKLDGDRFTTASSSPKTPLSEPQADAHGKPKTRGFNFRTISDKLDHRLESMSQSIAPKDSPLISPSRTSSSPSKGESLELEGRESTGTGKIPRPSTTSTSTKSSSKRKTKKETSAYLLGLHKKTPQEQMVGCDYSGWMKKKSSALMATWKPRLFVLKGRRLSYYYTENDEEERGVIDISFHRVLPADNDYLTGLHATMTGAKAKPASPSDAMTPTIASTQAANQPDDGGPNSDSMFIFKLVPPRAGLSKAVSFTKPTVHYFAVPNLKQGRLWMAALMKATIDRDDTKPVTTSYQQKTISLAKARAMRHRPPALMGLDEKGEEKTPVEEEGPPLPKTPAVDVSGLNIMGVIFDTTNDEAVNSGVSGLMERMSSEKANGERAQSVSTAVPSITEEGSSKSSE